MSKIIDKTTGKTNFEDDQTVCGTVLDYLESENISTVLWESLSKLIQTMTGDAITPFNTIGEMIKCIPYIVNGGEETEILCVFNNKISYYVLGWNHEDNSEMWNQILADTFKNLEVVEN